MSTIIELRANNILRLKAVRIKPDGAPLVQITGANAQGKTSVLNAIALALGGKRWQDAKPIHEGADKGDIEVTLDNGMTIRRTLTHGGAGGALVVTDVTGSNVTKPQTVLDRMAASIAFDPLAFSRMKPPEQVETLKKIVGIDFSTIEEERSVAFMHRTMVNRAVEDIKSRIAAIGPKHPNTPPTEESIVELAKEHAEATAHNLEVAKLISNRTTWVDAMKETERKIVELKRKLEEQEKILADQAANAQAVDGKIAVAETIDVEKIAARMGTIEETNRRVRENANRAKLLAEFDTKSAEADALSEKIVGFDRQKRETLAAAKFPIEGLSFDRDGVVYQGQPFTQASGAEALRVSVAIALAMSPDLKVLLIRDGSLLDADNLALIAEMADSAGAQVWIERVDTSGRVGFVIEDGENADAAAE